MNEPKRSSRADRVSQLDSHAIVKDARNALQSTQRRLFGKRILTLGGLMLLSGCDLTDDQSVNTMLRRVSSFNDDVQASLFDPRKLAPTYPESMIAPSR